MRDWRFEETGGSAGEGEYGEEGTHGDGFWLRIEDVARLSGSWIHLSPPFSSTPL